MAFVAPTTARFILGTDPAQLSSGIGASSFTSASAALRSTRFTTQPAQHHRHNRRAHNFPVTAAPARAMLEEGTKAPHFSVTDSDGNSVSLSDFAGSKLVLYFSPGAGAGCTSQSCSFRDAEAAFSSLDAKILAVSAQGKGASAAFKANNGLPFPVLPDANRELQKMYAVPATFGLIPGRITYVIDRDGVIRKAYNNAFSMGSHIDVSKKALQSIA